MDSVVLVQVGQLFEGPLAELAVVLSYIGVYQVMLCQLLTTLEALITVGTEVAPVRVY